MYPYVVVRYLATVYGRFPVKFVGSEPTTLDSKACENAVVVGCPQPYTVDERLTPEARNALTGVARYACQQSGHRMCVVFGKKDCVYLEPEGVAKHSDKPPSGGIQWLRFPIRLKDD